MIQKKLQGTIYISNLKPELKARILSYKPDRKDLQKFHLEENKEKLKQITDLNQLIFNSENELYENLNLLFLNKQYFNYVGSNLLNFNPGPNKYNEYLNLQEWVYKQKNKKDSDKPHLYNYIKNIYKEMITDNSSKVINLLGEVGSGKTFTLIHILEYLTYTSCHENYQNEVYDLISKSIQLVHLMGSVVRKDNIESTCCSLVINISYNDENKICNFDFESTIVDFTLPFSENGRSFSILHALMCANKELKKMLELPDEAGLSFFKKFNNNFDNKTKEKFRLNDLEIWSRFHGLLKYFGFNKEEELEILQLLSFILLLNEATIIRKKKNGKDYFSLNKTFNIRKISKNLSINDEEFLKLLGNFDDINDLKTILISLMKYIYSFVFEHIKCKVKKFCAKYFRFLKENDRIFGTEKNLKHLFLTDSSGEIEDQTLGGLTTNLFQEFSNLFTNQEYIKTIEIIEDNEIKVKYLNRLHSQDALDSLIGQNGILNILDIGLDEKNLNKYKAICSTDLKLRKCIQFSEQDLINKKDNNVKDQFVFRFKFSNKTVVYNLESLYLESRSLVFNNRIRSIFENSNNEVLKDALKQCDKSNLFIIKDISALIKYNLNKLYENLQNLPCFSIYCFHSIHSENNYFRQTKLNNNDNNMINFEKTRVICQESPIISTLYWESFGFKELITIENFMNEFGKPFSSIKDKIINSKALKSKFKDFSLKNLSNKEIVKFILSILIPDNLYLIGNSIILFKQGILKKIGKIIDNLIEMHKINRGTENTMKRMDSLSTIKSNKTSIRRNTSLEKSIKLQRSASNPSNRKFSNTKNKDFMFHFFSFYETSKQISTNNKILPKTSDRPIQKYLNHEKNFCSNELKQNLIEDKLESVKFIEDYVKENNIILIKNQNIFNAFKNLITKGNENVELFDYGDYLKQIKYIQSYFLGFLSRRKYQIFRYAVKKIILAQKYIRSWIIKIKFRRFKIVSAHVVKIQRTYKNHLIKRIYGIIKVQRFVRNFLRKKQIRKISEIEKAKIDFENELDDLGVKENERRKIIRSTNEKNSERKIEECDKSRIIEQLLDLNKNEFHDYDISHSINSRSLIPKKKVAQDSKKHNYNKKIEDKLIKSGETTKIKIDEMKMRKLKEEETNLLFQNRNKKKICGSNSKAIVDSFINRMTDTKKKYEERKEELRFQKIIQLDKESTFKPKISQLAKKIGRRSVEDLYNWHELKEKNLMERIDEKVNNEINSIKEMRSKKLKMNKSSEIMLEYKNQRLKENSVCSNIEEKDLWPVNFKKKLFT